jgi:Na+-driven multidrug efflux pump
MLFQVSGRPKESLFLSSCRQGIFFIPLIFILPRVLGITGLEICQPIANILSALISIPFLVKYFQDVKN